MVISQIAGLATAFGTGELSGAGFGPNYTILMKLGYEFFAPRILEEMEKNPNVFFQDTLWFKKFQKQIKLYSDTIMHETLNTLIAIPQKTLDEIADKFREEGSSAIPDLSNVPISASPALNQVIVLTKVLETLVKALQNMDFNFNILPQAFGHTEDSSSTTTDTPGEHGPSPPALTQQQLLDKYPTWGEYRQNGGLLLKAQWKKAKGIDEFENFVPPNLKVIDFTWLNVNALGMIRKNKNNRWEIFTNPQRNGNWQSKRREFTGKLAAINWMHKNGFPSSTHATHQSGPLYLGLAQAIFFTPKTKITQYQNK